MTALTDVLKSAAGDKATKLRVLNGLQFLAPFVTVESGSKLWGCVSDCVDLNEKLNPKLRALWGDVRAKLGCDPRFETTGPCFAKKDTEDLATGFRTTGDEVPGFALIDVRNKPFWFGDGGENSSKPVLVQGLKRPFFMARTLTTVSQYAQFVGDKDYASHFEGEGRQWLDGSYDNKASDHLNTWPEWRPKEQRNAPQFWQDQLANPLRPVVDVSWFEAQAYVQWLNASVATQGLTRYVASLPTELQWECAARYAADGVLSQRAFPWKQGPADAEADKKEFELYANLGELVGHPTTVGLYPKGRSDAGLADMAGNVLEWMGHAYVEGDDPNTELKLPEVTDVHLLRGGSWSHVPDLARCSYRYRLLRGSWHGALGFRVVLSLAK